MRVALLTTFQATRKEPLATLLERIHDAFLAAGQAGFSWRFSLSDAPVPDSVSIVDRVLKRFPQLEPLVFNSPGMPGGPPVRQIANDPESPAGGEPIEFATLLAIAKGVPRSFPFHDVSVHFHSAAFGELPQSTQAGGALPGVIVGDSWWVSGRARSLSAVTIVDADPAAKNLPAQPDTVAAIFAVCGKAKKTVQVPFAATPESDAVAAAKATPNPETASAVAEVGRDYRARLADVVEHAALPHDLPPALEAMNSTRLGETAGSRKPPLVRAFKPMGYDCRGGSGTFTLRRRTPGNLTVEINLDVGTWGRSLLGSFAVHGLGFRATLPLPVSKRAMAGQYPIGDAARWGQLVENLAALVAELDRSFVPAIEQAAGPSPEWYRPES